jgi:hypothetical protein
MYDSNLQMYGNSVEEATNVIVLFLLQKSTVL